jgi:hypothetical protein
MSKKHIRIETYGNPEDMEYSVSLNTDRDKEKYIHRVEQVVRSSMEYRDYIAYLKEYVDMGKCAFFNSVENSQGSKVRIEIHHEPLTLYDIVKVVLNKYLDEAIPLNDLYIADEVMQIHYQNQVGLIPLSKSIHQIVHNSDEIVIPLILVFGDYQSFLTEYEDYIDEDIYDKIERKINETKKIKQDMIDKLTPSYVYVDVDGFSLPKKVEIESKEKNVS